MNLLIDKQAYLMSYKSKLKDEYNSVYEYIKKISTLSCEICQRISRDIILTNGKVHYYHNVTYYIPFNSDLSPRYYTSNYILFVLCKTLHLPLEMLIQKNEIANGLTPFFLYLICNITDIEHKEIKPDEIYCGSLPNELIKELENCSMPKHIYKTMTAIEVEDLLKTALKNYKMDNFEKRFIKYLITHLNDVPLSFISVNIKNRLKTVNTEDANALKVIIDDLYYAFSMYLIGNLTEEEKVLVKRVLDFAKIIYFKEV